MSTNAAKKKKRSKAQIIRADRLKRAKAKKAKDIKRARIDPSFFVEYAFRHEKTGKRITNEQFHRDWQDFFTETRWGVVEAAVEHGKSVQIGVARVIWEIGHNPDLRVLLIGAGEDAAKKLLRGIRRHIEKNKRIREVFPNLKRSGRRGDPWNDDDIIVARKSLARDPTIQARGVGSRNIIGSRTDLAVLDDILGMDNTRTKPSRDKLEVWFDDVVFTRISDDYENLDYGRVFFIGNPWDQDDLIQRLKGRKGWRSITTSAVVNPDDPVSKWVPSWPAQWPLKRLLDKRDGMLEVSFARKYLCRVLSEGLRRFKKPWLDRMFELGRGRTFLKKQPWGRDHRPLRCFTGLDPAVGEKDLDALSCLFTIAIDDAMRRCVVDVRTGRWTGPELLRQCRIVSSIFDSELIVESNATQIWMAQFAGEHGIIVRTFFTGAHNKWSEEYGVESLAIEIKAGLWVAPSGATGHDIHDELVEWRRELWDYDPQSHTGDRVMGSWLAREGARLFYRDRVQKTDHAYR